MIEDILKDKNDIEFKPNQYYLVKNSDWSSSGYNIFIYRKGKLECDCSGNILEITDENIEGIIEL